MIRWEQVVRFETPENIPVTYKLAGPGTRFIACVFDHIVIVAAILAMTVLTMVVLLLLAQLNIGIEGDLFADGAEGFMTWIMLATAIQVVLYLGYFTVLEWIWNGQTLGARIMGVRVVMDRGFSLSFAGVFLRNIFRVIDVIPVLWVVPVVSEKLQRLGDMAAGTLLVREENEAHQDIRAQLSERPPSESVFAINQVHVNSLQHVDVAAAEMFLLRRDGLHPAHRQELAETLCANLSRRIGREEPVDPSQAERFIEDLLSAYARWEARELA